MKIKVETPNGLQEDEVIGGYTVEGRGARAGEINIVAQKPYLLAVFRINDNEASFGGITNTAQERFLSTEPGDTWKYRSWTMRNLTEEEVRNIVEDKTFIWSLRGG